MKRILNSSELELFHQTNDQDRFLANRFAGKEAATKALGTGFSQGITWKDFGVSNKSSGQPELILSNKVEKLFITKGITSSHISLTDELPWSMAFVILEK